MASINEKLSPQQVRNMLGQEQCYNGSIYNHFWLNELVCDPNVKVVEKNDIIYLTSGEPDVRVNGFRPTYKITLDGDNILPVFAGLEGISVEVGENEPQLLLDSTTAVTRAISQLPKDERSPIVVYRPQIYFNKNQEPIYTARGLKLIAGNYEFEHGYHITALAGEVSKIFNCSPTGA